MRSMKRVRAIMFFAAFAVLCGGGVARAQENAPEAPVVVAQAGGSAVYADDDSDPATKGDLRRLQGDFGRLQAEVGGLRNEVGMVRDNVIRLDERMDAQEKELRHLREEMSAIRDMMHSNFQWLIAAIIAVLGLPQFLSWLGRMRGSGRSVAAGMFMVALPAAAIVAALLLTDNAAAQENESAPVVRAQVEQVGAATHNPPAMSGELRGTESRREFLFDALRKDLRIIHDTLAALTFILMAGLVGGWFSVMLGIALKSRRKGMTSGMATMALMMVSISFAGVAFHNAKTEADAEFKAAITAARVESNNARTDY